MKTDLKESVTQHSIFNLPAELRQAVNMLVRRHASATRRESFL